MCVSPASIPAPNRPRNRLSRGDRITRAAELVAVRRSGTRIRAADLDVRAMETSATKPRVGFVVPKYKHSAVERNRLKRRLRELVRTRLLPALQGGGTGNSAAGGSVDVVLRALPTAYGTPYSALAAQLDRVGAGVRARAMSSGR